MMPSWTRWLLAPLHLLALAGTAKSFEANPILGSRRLNRVGLHLARKSLAARLAARRRRRLARHLAPEHRAALDRDGFLLLPDFLEPARFAALRAEILSLQTPAREFLDGYTLTRLIPLDGPNLRQLPTARAVLQAPGYRALHDYAGSFRRRPHLFIQSIFSQVRPAPPDVQSFFHSDTFHPTVKSWLFLTDVAPEDAAFTYVPGSHRTNRRHLAWERRAAMRAATGTDRSSAEGSLRIEEAALARLGYRSPVRLAVAANTLVVADTSGLHRRGITGRPGCRISIWAYARSNPFLPWSGGDPLGLPLIRDHAVRGFWAVQDLLKRLRGARGGWRWVGSRRPDTPPKPAAIPPVAARPAGGSAPAPLLS